MYLLIVKHRNIFGGFCKHLVYIFICGNINFFVFRDSGNMLFIFCISGTSVKILGTSWCIFDCGNVFIPFVFWEHLCIYSDCGNIGIHHHLYFGNIFVGFWEHLVYIFNCGNINFFVFRDCGNVLFIFSCISGTSVKILGTSWCIFDCGNVFIPFVFWEHLLYIF